MSGEESSNLCVKMSRAKVKSLKKNPGKKHLPGWLSIKTYQKIPLKYKYLVTLVLLSVTVLNYKQMILYWLVTTELRDESVDHLSNTQSVIILINFTPLCYRSDVTSDLNIELLSDVSPGCFENIKICLTEQDTQNTGHKSFRKPFCERVWGW